MPCGVRSLSRVICNAVRSMVGDMGAEAASSSRRRRRAELRYPLLLSASQSRKDGVTTMSEDNDFSRQAGDSFRFLISMSVQDAMQRRLRYHLLRLTAVGLARDDLDDLGELCRLGSSGSRQSSRRAREAVGGARRTQPGPPRRRPMRTVGFSARSPADSPSPSAVSAVSAASAASSPSACSPAGIRWVGT
jgi:hypothetical protein